MLASPFVSRPALALISALLSYTSAQAVSGASYLAGGGAPGAASYRLVDDYQPSTFFSKFAFYDRYDPTYGHVQYVNESVAETNGYVSISNHNTAIIKPDTTTLWPRGGSGRPSVRITSKNTYFHGLFLLDLTHMPWGCGTWPAYWLLGPNWPYTGEIDVIEGVNTAQNNTLSLHSSAGCSIAGSGQTGTFKTNNCDAYENDNSGCGTLLDTAANPHNYGSTFNANGGGVYATEWTSEYIKHWVFPRGSIPSSIANGVPDPSQFGLPAVNAQGDCDIDAHFQNMSVIFNIDFCGAWAGNVYRDFPECPQNPNLTVSAIDSCVDFVGNNPTQLGEAYFEINSLRVYQMPGGVRATSAYSTSLSSITTGISTFNTIPLGQGAPTTASSFSTALSYTGPLSSSILASSLAATAPQTSMSPGSTGLPASVASCPSADGQTVVDNCGVSYIVKCGGDTTSGAGVPISVSTFNDCFEICSGGGQGVCSAFTFVISTKNCYLKSSASEQFSGGSTDMIGAIILVYYGTDTPSPTSTSRVCAASYTAIPSSTSAGSPWSTSGPVAALSSSSQTWASYSAISSSVSTALSILPDATSTTAMVMSNGISSNSPAVPESGTSTTIISDSSWIVTSELDSSSTSSSVPSEEPSSTSAPTPSCPVGSASDICSDSSALGTCSSMNGATYLLSCGRIWVGTEVSADVTSDSDNKRSLDKRVTAPDFGTCQAICDTNSACVAVNYIGTNCTLFSQVTGQQAYPGAVTAAQVPDDEPDCPSSEAATYTDTNGGVYTLGCYISFAGNTIGSPIFKAVFSDCLPYCDTLSGCAGVEYDMLQSLCYLKSSFAGTNTPDNSRMYAMRNGVSSTGSATTNAPTVTITPGLLTTTLSLSSGMTVTEIPTTTITTTFPPGGSFTTIGSGSTPSSYYVFTTTGTPGTSASLCVTCGLVPTVITNPNAQTSGPIYRTTGAVILTSLYSPYGTCPTPLARSYTTVFTTHTITSCGPEPICPNPGWIIIGGSATRTDASTVTTTDSHGNTITYTQIPTSSQPLTGPGGVTLTSGGSGGGQGGSSNTLSPPSSTASPGPTPTLPTCPFSNGQIYTDSMGVQYEILCNTLFTSTTLQTEAQPRIADCIASCDMYNLVNMYSNALCQGTSWISGQQTDNCLLKAGTSRVPLIGTHSARLLSRVIVPGNGTMPGGDGNGGSNTISTGSMSGSPSSSIGSGQSSSSGGYSGSGPGTGVGTGVPITTVIGGQTVVSTYYATPTGNPGGSSNGGSGGGSGGGTGPGSTVYDVSTAYTYYVSNGVTYTSTYGVTTAISVIYAPASTNTVTTTTVSVSVTTAVTTAVSTAYATTVQYLTTVSNGVTTVISRDVSTAYVVSTAPGRVSTRVIVSTASNGRVSTQYIVSTVSGGAGGSGTATVTQAGPTVTASQGSGVVTVTQSGGGGGSGSGGVVTVTAAPVTATQYVYTSSSSSSTSTCRTTSTNYLNGVLPGK